MQVENGASRKRGKISIKTEPKISNENTKHGSTRRCEDNDVSKEIVQPWFFKFYKQTDSEEDLIDKNHIVKDFFGHFKLEFEDENVKAKIRKRHKLMSRINECVNKNQEYYGRVKSKV